jgi:transposase
MAYASCKDGPTRTRFQAVRLYGIGYSVVQIMDITGCSRTSLMEWCATYRQKGRTALLDQRRGGNRARLTKGQIQDLKDRLHTYTPSDLFGSRAATLDGQFWTIPTCSRPWSSGMAFAIKVVVPIIVTLTFVGSAISVRPRCTSPALRPRWLISKPS